MGILALLYRSIIKMPFEIDNPAEDMLYVCVNKATYTECNEDIFPAMDQILKDNAKAKLVLDISGGFAKSWESMKIEGKLKARLIKFYTLGFICSHSKLAAIMKPFLVGIKYQSFPAGSKDEAIEWAKVN